MKILKPEISILNPKRKFVPGADVQRTWKAFGWKPTSPAERRKRANFKTL
jgi:hypothetical protein